MVRVFGVTALAGLVLILIAFWKGVSDWKVSQQTQTIFNTGVVLWLIGFVACNIL